MSIQLNNIHTNKQLNKHTHTHETPKTHAQTGLTVGVIPESADPGPPLAPPLAPLPPPAMGGVVDGLDCCCCCCWELGVVLLLPGLLL